MKSTPLLNLTLLLLLAGPSFGAPEAVIDVDGKPVTTNTSYLIYPATGGTEGGLTLSPPNASFFCPLYVTQAEGIDNTVLPARFFPIDPEAELAVRVSTDMNIDFNTVQLCQGSSNVWQLGHVEGQRRFVKSGGVKGSPGIKTLSNWFKIEKDDKSKGNVYKLVFCPNVCSFCKVVCGELGVMKDGGERFVLGLAPNLKPHRVVFKEA